MSGDPRILVPALGLGYVAVFGLMFWLRREGFQLRFTLEGLAITVLGTVMAFYGLIGPILFLIVLYLLTMRARVLADAGNFLSNNGHFREALLMFHLGERAWPDQIGRFLLEVDKGVTLFRMGSIKKAIDALESALESSSVEVPTKHLAACHYNLGIAYRKAGEEEASRKHFLTVLDMDPDSIYAIGARTGLRQMSQQRKTSENSQTG
jgi:tetratricopeptide (TPR) repeat protein